MSLSPSVARGVELKNISGATGSSSVVIPLGTNNGRIATDGYTKPKLVIGGSITGGEFLGRSPRVTRGVKLINISGTRTSPSITISISSNDRRVATNPDTISKPIIDVSITGGDFNDLHRQQACHGCRHTPKGGPIANLKFILGGVVGQLSFGGAHR